MIFYLNEEKQRKVFVVFLLIYAFLLRTNEALGVPAYAVGCPKSVIWLRLSVSLSFFPIPSGKKDTYKGAFFNIPFLKFKLISEESACVGVQFIFVANRNTHKFCSVINFKVCGIYRFADIGKPHFRRLTARKYGYALDI